MHAISAVKYATVHDRMTGPLILSVTEVAQKLVAQRVTLVVVVSPYCVAHVKMTAVKAVVTLKILYLFNRKP